MNARTLNPLSRIETDSLPFSNGRYEVSVNLVQESLTLSSEYNDKE